MTLSYARENYSKLWRNANRNGQKFSLYRFKSKLKDDPSYAKKVAERNRKWKSEHPWYVHLHNAYGRCNYKTTNKYEYYGGRGIKCLLSPKEIKSLWDRDRAELMNQPSLDRINPDKDYKTSNCRFLEMEINRKSRRPSGTVILK